MRRILRALMGRVYGTEAGKGDVWREEADVFEEGDEGGGDVLASWRLSRGASLG